MHYRTSPQFACVTLTLSGFRPGVRLTIQIDDGPRKVLAGGPGHTPVVTGADGAVTVRSAFADFRDAIRHVTISGPNGQGSVSKQVKVG